MLEKFSISEGKNCLSHFFLLFLNSNQHISVFVLCLSPWEKEKILLTLKMTSDFLYKVKITYPYSLIVVNNSLCADILKILSFLLSFSILYGLCLFKTFIISWSDRILWISNHLAPQRVWIFCSFFEWGFIFSNKLCLRNEFVMNHWGLVKCQLSLSGEVFPPNLLFLFLSLFYVDSKWKLL